MKVARLKTRRCRRRVACVESEVMKITSKHMTEWVQSSPCFLGCCATEGLRQQHSGLIRKKHKSQCHQKQSQESKNNTSPLFSCTSNQQHAYDRGVQLNPPHPRSAHMPAHARARSWQVNPVLIDATKWCLKKRRCSHSVNTTLFCKSTHYLCVRQPLRLSQELIFYFI